MPENPTKTITYTYNDSNWKDKLTSFDGKAITYDEIGNPLTCDGYTFTWEEGRQLARIQGNGFDIAYKYNDQGIRTEKTVNGVTTKYYLLGDKVILETNGTDTIHYSYDSQDNLVSMNLNGVEYYYVRNGQGDIIALIDSNGNEVVTYTYDSWGEIISIDGSLATTVGVKNPYRYRGYRYDEETKLYYLKSRYYNPEWGRFINADAIAGNVGVLLSHNVYSYVINNPINQSDDGGFIAPAVVYAAYAYALSIASSPDTQRDLQFMAIDLAKGDYLAVALDLVGILVPGGTGFGQLSKPTQRIAGRLLIWIDETINIKSLIGKTGSWHKGSFSTAAESLYYHFKKHGKEVGAVSAEQYLRKAEAFKNKLRGASKYKVDGCVNGVFRYVKDGKYIDLAPDGTIISFGKR